MKSISVEELKDLRESGVPFFLLDVREPSEFAGGKISGAVNIPMNDVERRLRELPKDRQIVVMCHAGSRSARMTGVLNKLGYKDAVNLTGGISAWSRLADPKAASGGMSLFGLLKSIFGSGRQS